MEKQVIQIAKKAGEILSNGFKSRYNVKFKLDNPWEALTPYDLKAEKFIYKELMKLTPGYGMLGEEFGHRGSTENFWVVDPLDGTMAFSRGVGEFGTIIGLVEKGEVTLGCVYIPVSDELIIAKKGKGAFLNGKRVHVSDKKNLHHSLIYWNWGMKEVSSKVRNDIRDQIIQKDVVDFKSISACYSSVRVAGGGFDAVMLKYAKTWDYVGTSVILSEAGAKVTDFLGKPYTWKSKNYVAANPSLHKELLPLVKKAYENQEV